MLFKMLCCKSSDGNDLFDFSKSVPNSQSISAEAHSIVNMAYLRPMVER